jgi:hypothetical protein
MAGAVRVWIDCRHMKRPVVMAAVLIAAACSTKQVKPVAALKDKRICIIEASGPNAGTFAEAYRKALEERGYAADVFMETARSSICPVTTRYAARWNFDGPIRYLAYAELRVYDEGREIGRAQFNARNSRFINAAQEIREMVNELFPK